VREGPSKGGGESVGKEVSLAAGPKKEKGSQSGGLTQSVKAFPVSQAGGKRKRDMVSGPGDDPYYLD